MIVRRKRLTRRTKKTVLIVGEGPTEKAFLRYLKGLYVTRDMHISVSVECGSGGSPRNVVEKTIRLRGSRDYDKCFVLIDADIPLETDKKLLSRIKQKPKIEILKSTPCIEGLFLIILGGSRSDSSDKCKSEFELRHLSSDKKTDKRSYERLFDRNMIDTARSQVEELDSVLKAMDI